jgi:hypothetical protein
MRVMAIKKGQTERRRTISKKWTRFGVTVGARSSSSDIAPLMLTKTIAERQASWLEKVLAEEHERDKKHADRIELPG